MAAYSYVIAHCIDSLPAALSRVCALACAHITALLFESEASPLRSGRPASRLDDTLSPAPLPQGLLGADAK